MKVVRWLVRIVAVVVLLVAGLFVGARFHDGPLGLVPGGALVAGERVAAPVGDWAFATDIDTIELQLDGESSSRTTWVLVNQGRAFIPASLSFPPGKRWHKTADQNGAAWLRIGGQRYPVTLTRTKDEALETQLRSVVGNKYDVGPASGEDGVWFFEVVSRPVSD
ncbi:MAG: hypothetical protein WEF50_01695 [Myxococcota bacterium]